MSLVLCFFRPSGALDLLALGPTVETVGYDRSSLRDFRDCYGWRVETLIVEQLSGIGSPLL